MTEWNQFTTTRLSPFVSIVTVSLNAAGTIGDTLASVSMQQRTFDIEHICVDGGSGDGTREIIDAWAARNAHIRRIYAPDGGIFDAMNKGLRAAAGEYVLFLNADDFLVAPDTLATAMGGSSPGGSRNPDLIAGDVAMGSIGRRGPWRHRRVPRLLTRLHGTGLYATHQGLFAKRRMLEDAGGFDARRKFAADTNLYYDIERKYKPSIRLIGRDVAFMRAGGTANAGTKAMCLGTAEIYAHLLPAHGRLRSAAMAFVKTLQSLAELRYGRCPHERWFARAAAGARAQPAADSPSRPDSAQPL